MANRSRSIARFLYTIYRQDGTMEVLPISHKKSFDELYTILNCTTLERIPKEYYAGKIDGGIVFGDEEGRYKPDNHRNPHFNVLIAEGAEWDVVGDCVHEKAIRKTV